MLITELHDLLVEDFTKNQESILIILDQSKAYDIVSHNILLSKMKAIGYQPQALRITKTFMEGRGQLVQLDGTRSDTLVCRNHSVIQGSMLSCILFIIYITRRYGGLWPPTSSSSRGDLGALWAPKYSTVQYNTVQYSTVQYSTVQ